METRPPRSPGQAVGLALIAGLIILDSILGVLLFQVPISFLSFLVGAFLLLSAPAIMLVAFFTACLSAARYYVEDMALIIQWGRLRQIVPLDQIGEILYGQDLPVLKGFRGLRWPGYLLGRGKLIDRQGEGMPARFYSSRPLREQVVVTTGSTAYGISPPDPEEFVNSLRAMFLLENDGRRPALSESMSFLGWSIWRDRLAQILLGLATLLNAALFFYLSAIMGNLADEVALHFNSQGVPDRLGSPAGLLILPLIGFLAWLVAILFGWYFYHVRDERPTAYVVWGSMVAIQLAAWVAVIGLLGAS